MRSGRPGPVLIDLPFDVQMAEIEFDLDTYEPLPVYKPRATRAQVEKALAMLNEAERPLIVAGGGIINADASDLLVEFAELTGVPVIPTLMGWGTIPDDHPLMAGMGGCRPATATATRRCSRPTSCSASATAGPTATPAPSRSTPRAASSCTSTSSRPRSAACSRPTSASSRTPSAALELFVEVASEWKAAGKLKDRIGVGARSASERKRTMLRKTNFDNVPMKPQRVYQEMNKAFGRDTCYVTTIGLSQIAGAQFLHVYKPRNWINCGQAGPLGWTMPAALGVRAADPDRTIVALSGDYDFQFMIEELAVGAQFKLPYLHVVVNNSYLGLIRQAQRGFEMDYCVQLGFDNINAPELEPATASTTSRSPRALGCKAIRVHEPEEIEPAFEQARGWMEEYQVPVVIEFILERVTNISMGTEIDNVNEFEELAAGPEDAPTPSGCSIERTGGRSDAEVLRQPHDALQRARFLDRFAAAARRGFEGSSSCFPTPFPKEQLAGRSARERADPGAAQPAGRRLGRRRARHRLPARPRRRIPGRRRPAIDYATALGCPQVNCLAGIAPQGVDAESRAADLRRQPALRGRAARARPASSC